MPISAVIHLIPPEDVTLRPTMGHYAHAAFLSLLRSGHPVKAAEVHAAAKQTPFTLSPLIGKGERRGNLLRIRAGTECWLRYTFLDDELVMQFGNAFLTQSQPSIRLGEATFQLSRMVATASEKEEWSGSHTYEDLIESAELDPWCHVEFLSPTAFRRLTPRGSETRNDPDIDLPRFYQSWVNKWNAFAPMRIDKQRVSDLVNHHACLMSLQSDSKMLDFGRHKEAGFVGRCSYTFFPGRRPRNNEERESLRLVNILTDFAFYCGTGYKTTMGMGQTRRRKAVASGE